MRGGGEMGKQANIQQVLVIFLRNIREIAVILEEPIRTDQHWPVSQLDHPVSWLAKLWSLCFTERLEGNTAGLASEPTVYVWEWRVEITSSAL